jgi:hypothetical protein
MRKGIICLVIIFIFISKTNSQEEPNPLVLQMNIGDEIWIDGTIVVFIRTLNL